MSMNYTAASEKAKKYVQRNQLEKAVALWTQFIPNAGDNDAANALNNLGDLCVRKKDPVTAIDHYLQASEAFEKAGFPLKSIAALKKILKLDPERAEVYLRLGDVNARRDMIGNAVEAYLNVARLQVAHGQRDDALAMVQKVCILDPVNTRHRLQLAAELFELGFTDQAIEETINAVDLFLQNGNLEEAERYCRHLLDLEPGCEAAQERLERMAHWGEAEPSRGGGDGDEGSIDELFAELDAPGGADTQVSVSPEPAEPAEAAEPGWEPDPGADAEAGAPEVGFEELLETSPQAHEEEPEEAAPTDFGDIPLEATSYDLDTEEAAPGADPDALHHQAMTEMDGGDLAAALDLFEQAVDAHLANDDFAAADGVLADYLAIDPDNPRAYEIRLRIVEGRDPAAEQATRDRLATLSGQEPAAPDAGPDADSPDPGLAVDGEADDMSVPFSEISLAADAATEHIELTPDAEPEGEPPAGEWSLDLDNSDTVDDTAEDTDTEAAPEPAAETPAEAEVAAEGEDEGDALDMASLDLTASFRDAAAETAEEAAPQELEAEAEAPEADEPAAVVLDEAELAAETPDAVGTAAAEVDLGGFDVKEALTEGAFYERQELTKEAVEVYRNVLSHDPHNAEATARLQALGVTVEPPPAAAPAAKAAPPAPVQGEGGSDEFLDFTEEIEDTIKKEVSGAWRQVGEEAQFDEILQAFRKGIQDEVSDDDSETHYDLGVAYHEMGLTEEAIGEFQLAIKGAARFADATIMLARCFSEVGKERLAVSRLRTAVARPDCGEDEWISLAYELASVLESLGEKEEARQMYEEVYSRDITYRDVAERVSQLS
jgi:tetratricopeptide (TPR) repeat protein